jgi:hypothetical protein
VVEEIIHLDGDLEALRQIVMGAEVGDRIAGRNSGPEVVSSVGFVRVVLVSSRIRTRYRDLIEVKAELRGCLQLGVRLSVLFGNQRNPIAGLNIDVAVESRIAGERRIAGAVGRSI